MEDVRIVDEPATALALLDPLRARVLAAFDEPGSASTVAKAIGETRQKVNYHVRALEDQELLVLVDEIPRRGLTERVLVASARSYVLSPELLGDRSAQPDRLDRLSTRYLIAVAARLLREVAVLTRRAEAVDRPLSTLTIDTDIRFASARERATFTAELGEAVASLAARYHDEQNADGRWHRLIVAAHPIPETGEVTRKADYDDR